MGIFLWDKILQVELFEVMEDHLFTFYRIAKLPFKMFHQLTVLVKFFHIFATFDNYFKIEKEHIIFTSILKTFEFNFLYFLC